GPEVTQDIEEISRSHAAVVEVVAAAPRELGVFQTESAIRLSGCIQHPPALNDDVGPNAVAGDDRDLMAAHAGRIPAEPGYPFGTWQPSSPIRTSLTFTRPAPSTRRASR